MKPLDTLEMNELIDMLASYSLEYSTLKRDMASFKKLNKYKSLVDSLMNEIDKRKRSTIGPYNDISNNQMDNQSKSA